MQLDDMCIDVCCTCRAPSFQLTREEGARVVGPSLLDRLSALSYRNLKELVRMSVPPTRSQERGRHGKLGW